MPFKKIFNRVWWYTPIILALGRLGQEDRDFDTCLGYIGR
jgi:hypothetical protein